MKAITLWQPWASLIAWGWKTIETRGHWRFKGLVGKRVAIHAGGKSDPHALAEISPHLTAEQISRYSRAVRDKEFPSGCVVATAKIVEARLLTPDDSAAALCACTPDRVGYLLADIQPICVAAHWPAVPVKGARGIWNWTPPKENTMAKDSGPKPKTLLDTDACDPMTGEPYDTPDEPDENDDEADPDAPDPDSPDQADPVDPDPDSPDDSPMDEGLLLARGKKAMDRLEEIEELEAEIRRWRALVGDAKDLLREHKTSYEAACARLFEFIHDTKDLPLFARDADDPTFGTDHGQADADPSAAELLDPVCDRWPSIPLAELQLHGLTDSLLATLQNCDPLVLHAGIDGDDELTLGHLSAWMTAKKDFWAKDLPGVGPAKREQIDDAWLDFWGDHPEFCQPKAATEETAATPEDSVAKTDAEADEAADDAEPDDEE